MSTDKSVVIDLFARHVSSGKAAFFRRAGIEFVMGRREGPYIWDIDGKTRLINCHCNGGVFNLGHRHPAVVQALIESVQTLDIGNHHLLSEPRAHLAARLAELTPGLTYTVFAVGGGEATDLAIKVARGYTGRRKIVSAGGGYHGHTGFALFTGDEKYFAPFGPRAPGFVQVPFNDVEALAAEVEDAAAVILETIPATLGMPIPTPEYLPQVRRLCDAHGALLILDEIQAGLGRTGRLWAYEHFNVVPDMVLLGKGLSGGLYPMAATMMRSELERVFHADPFIHISTFGGAEVGCPVALKVLEISADPAFLAHVRAMAQLFADGFVDLQRRHTGVLVGLRQMGLMMGIEMTHRACGPLFTKAAYDNGFLSIYAANDTRVAQFLPPLIIERPLAEELLQRVDAALAQVAKMLRSG
ncbi:MAG: aminotransferase class III-fold pyridoxal phosphate-dependent enzyme [Caldilinea sp.]|nr:aminotransferase class III-fold pyridoxal phosphate-dependent enzyme [Caldilinea sp.]MDW8442487.1 aminotransferase class III-fold pyridoxal phosphate-dependent enzyme [Caldilineaceae bacterium]